MKLTGIADLKAHLSRYLGQMKSGQEVVISGAARLEGFSVLPA